MNLIVGGFHLSEYISRNLKDEIISSKHISKCDEWQYAQDFLDSLSRVSGGLMVNCHNAVEHTAFNDYSRYNLEEIGQKVYFIYMLSEFVSDYDRKWIPIYILTPDDSGVIGFIYD